MAKLNASDKTRSSIAFLVGEIPCATFITALINGVSHERSVLVVGSERSGIASEFAADVRVERCPLSRLGRLCFAVSGLVRLLASRSIEIEPFWDYLTRRGRREAFGRFLYALPLLLHRPGIVHIQWAKALHRAMELRELHSFAVVLSLRGTHISSSPLGDVELMHRYRQDFPKLHAFHAVCHAIEKDAIAMGADADRIRVIYSGVDRALLEVPLVPLREELRPFRVLSVGRIHWRKGYHRALDAIRQLGESHTVDYAIIAGTPDDELLLQLDDLELGSVVHFEASMSREEVLEQMRINADLLLVPSMGEGIANVAIEAMAIGLPVLATQCGGMPELIESGESGLLCDPWDAGAMADGLRHFANLSLEERDTLRQNARRFVAETRQLDTLVSEMHALYDDAVRNQHADEL